MLGARLLPGFGQNATQTPAAALTQHARLAQAAIQNNNVAAAQAELNAMLEIDPANVDAHANLGMLKFVQGNYNEAAQHFKAALARSPSLWNAHAFLGLSEVKQGNDVSGRKLLEEAFPHIQDATLKKQSGLELVRAYSDAGRIEQAVPILENLQRAFPSDPEILYTKYRLHSEIASQALRKLTLDGAESAWLHEVYGQNYMTQDRYGAAVTEFQKALSLGPQLSGLHYQLGEALLLSERSEAKRAAAEHEFRLELEKNPQDAGCLLKLIEIAFERSQDEEATTLIERVLAAHPDLAAAHVAKSRVLEHAGNLQMAIAELETAEKLAPDERMAYYRLGALYRRQGRKADAARQMETFERLAAAERKSAIAGNTLQETAP